jgi:uncharacterized RDD family membrane protein YckC
MYQPWPVSCQRECGPASAQEEEALGALPPLRETQVLFAVMSMLFGSSAGQGGQVYASLNGLPFLMYLVLVVAYYTLLEGYLGQTVGKMLLGIKVVREDNGEVPGLSGAAIRTVLRIIDGIFFYLVAYIAVLASAKNQRLGDMVAHTLVVRR